MSVEKALKNYLACSGPKVKENEFYSFINEESNNALINTLFLLVNSEVGMMDDHKALDRVVEVLKLMEMMVKESIIELFLEES